MLQEGWRCRAKLVVRGSPEEPVIVGLYEQGTHEAVNIPECKGMPRVDPSDGRGSKGFRRLCCRMSNLKTPWFSSSTALLSLQVPVLLVPSGEQENFSQ